MKLLIFSILLISILAYITPTLSISPSMMGKNNFGEIWTSCGTDNDHFKISSVTIKPDPPVKNSAVTIVASGILDEDITGGEIHVVVKFGFITLFKKIENICDPSIPVGCPIKAGPYNRTVTTPVIPQQSPVGKYDGNIVVYDSNNQEVACVNVAFTLH
ncbi:hypothetical protein DICPUDRAFT_98719 [Dictyostelium purpureum]|uniref:MD-2-related lipid-recognition domain-containing protein n=1 Tax=Dictyostelium purpureum TaxID=5786 RepID=F0ZSZ0_DICPU|nr:uncharacterized protein DICPUDRAFT_98719 [Dictyostelium purpureum]EGC32926.1 hypothetical protein DICPUDRAFT_98719 [Dictyostelium purpureum]|eukprot:XP_003290534.1 hypothetical protein DICPUDRAFT_98719 [Dictyostelium purpureum]